MEAIGGRFYKVMSNETFTLHNNEMYPKFTKL